MWEGDYTDEAELEDWAAAISWHSNEALSERVLSSGTSTSSAFQDLLGEADRRGRFQHNYNKTTTSLQTEAAEHQLQCQSYYEEGLLGLPEELKLAICSLLRPRELAAIAAVCRSLRVLVSEERSFRKSLVGQPERYFLFRPRIALSELEHSAAPEHSVLEYLREEGFLFVSLDAEETQVVRDFKKSSLAYLNGLEERSASHRKKLQYSKKTKSLHPVGYAEMDELHGYLTRKSKPKKFPWPKASKKDKELARRYWSIMVRIVEGLLKNVAYSLGVPHELLLSLLQSDASQEEAWLMERIHGKGVHNNNNSSGSSKPPSPPKVLFSWGNTQGIKRPASSPSDEWNQPVLKMFHFREGNAIRPNYRTMHEYSRGLFKLATGFNDGSTPCGMQMLMPRAPNAQHRNFLPLFKLAQESDICVFAGFSLSKLCQAFSGPLGIRPIYLTANVGYEYPAAPQGSSCIQFDAHVSYPRLHATIEKVAAARGTQWSQPVSERVRCTNREFFNKKNPFGSFWFRSLSKKDDEGNAKKRVKWLVMGGAVACVAVPLVVVASPVWLPVGGMVWVCRERAAAERGNLAG